MAGSREEAGENFSEAAPILFVFVALLTAVSIYFPFIYPFYKREDVGWMDGE
jgi:hypothetical protein